MLEFDFEDIVIRKLKNVSSKNRPILAIVLVDRMLDHSSTTTELAESLGMSQANFYRRLSTALIEMGRLLREDPEVGEWLTKNGLSTKFIEHGIASRFLKS